MMWAAKGFVPTGVNATHSDLGRIIPSAVRMFPAARIITAHGVAVVMVTGAPDVIWVACVQHSRFFFAAKLCSGHIGQAMS